MSELARRWHLTPAQRFAENSRSHITLTDMRRMIEADHPKPDCCESCGMKAKLSLDHDHELERWGFTLLESFRGWLCDGCNQGIGMLRDSANGVRAALRYLDRERCYPQSVECGELLTLWNTEPRHWQGLPEILKHQSGRLPRR